MSCFLTTEETQATHLENSKFWLANLFVLSWSVVELNPTAARH